MLVHLHIKCELHLTDNSAGVSRAECKLISFKIIFNISVSVVHFWKIQFYFYTVRAWPSKAKHFAHSLYFAGRFMCACLHCGVPRTQSRPHCSPFSPLIQVPGDGSLNGNLPALIPRFSSRKNRLYKVEMLMKSNRLNRLIEGN